MQTTYVLPAQSGWNLAVPRPRIGPRQMVFGGVAGIQGDQAANTVNLPPELYPPLQSTAFFLSDEAALVGIGASTRPGGLAFTLPQTMVGVIDAIELLIDGIVITTSVVYSVMMNGAPVNGFNNLTILGRNGAQSVSKAMGPFLRCEIPIGGTVQMQFTDVDGGAITMGAQLRGWFWPADRG